MELSPYLAAIQNVTGSTPGEKYHSLNCIARAIITASNGQSDSIIVKPSAELPDVLIPLVKVEIARITRQPNEIVEALKSDDDLVFNRALRAKWFFDGSIDNVTNIHYFHDHIFKFICIKNRYILIKFIAFYLTSSKKYIIAEEFYSKLFKMYGKNCAEPILLACSESFIWDTIKAHRLILSVRIFKKLLQKYPTIIVNYLKLGKCNRDSSEENSLYIPVCNYKKYLPQLLKLYPDIFIELIEIYENFLSGEKISRKFTNQFLKIGMDIIIKQAKKFVEFINLEILTSTLTKEQFKKFYRNLFPEKLIKNHMDFPFHQLYNYLKYYAKEEAMPLFLATFEEVYKENFLECDNLIDPYVMKLLSPEQRANIARKKLKEDPNLIKFEGETSWTIYLPINESISIFKKYISSNNEYNFDENHRGECLKLMICSCAIQNDTDALLDVLEYIFNRHRNENFNIFQEVMWTLTSKFKLHELSLKHWEILNKFIQLMHKKNESYWSTISNIVESRIHFNLINNLPIRDSIEFYVSNSIKTYHNWNILEKKPEYERKCLDEILIVAQSCLSSVVNNKEIEKLISSLYDAIISFNERNSKMEHPLEEISLNNYPWLIEHIYALVRDPHKNNNIKSKLKIYHKDLYYSWFNEPREEKEELIDLHKSHIWKKNPQKILNRWEEYLERARNNMYYNYGRKFIKAMRWYQDIPIKFVEKCHENIFKKNAYEYLEVIALLLEGQAFEHIIQLLLSRPANKLQDDDSHESYSLLSTISRIIHLMNPPVSLELTLRFCKVDDIHFVASYLNVLTRRIPIDKILQFAKNLIDQPVSISKHGMRMWWTVVTNEEVPDVLIYLWKSTKHHTLRALLFNKIYQVFISNPDDKTWILMEQCLDGIIPDDKIALSIIFNCSNIHSIYITNYVIELFKILDKFKNIEDGLDTKTIWNYTETLLQNIHATCNFSEEFHQEILQKYFADLSIPSIILQAAHGYLFRCYIYPAKDKFETRLKFFSQLLVGILTNGWDISHPDDKTFFPANYKIHSISNEIMCMSDDINRTKFIDEVLKVYLSVLKPWHAPKFYLCCIFGSLYHNNISSKKYANKISEVLPMLIETFSIGFIDEISGIFLECISNLFHTYKFNDPLIYNLINDLLELNNDLTITLAIKIFARIDETKYEEQRMKIYQNLRQHKSRIAIAFAYMKINSREPH